MQQKVTHLPQCHFPGRDYSPSEILAIAESPLAARYQESQERSKLAIRSAVEKKMASESLSRAARKEQRLKAILQCLSECDTQTVTNLMKFIGDKISRKTAFELLKELEANHLVCRTSNTTWSLT